MRLVTMLGCAILALPFGLVPVSAQGSPGGMGGFGGGGGRHRGGGGMHRGEGGEARGAPRAADPVIMDGPPPTDQMTQLLTLNGAQRTSYDSMYQAFMAASRPSRDSAHTIRTVMDSLFRGGDRDAARQQAAPLKQLNTTLEKEQKEFDDSLKTLLDKDQWQAYEDWRDQQRKFAEDQQRQHWQESDGGRRHPGS